MELSKTPEIQVLSEVENQMAEAWATPKSKESLKKAKEAAIVDIILDDKTDSAYEAFEAERTQEEMND